METNGALKHQHLGCQPSQFEGHENGPAVLYAILRIQKMWRSYYDKGKIGKIVKCCIGDGACNFSKCDANTTIVDNVTTLDDVQEHAVDKMTSDEAHAPSTVKDLVQLRDGEVLELHGDVHSASSEVNS